MRTVLRLTLGTALCLSMISLALAQPCVVPDDGTGTVTLPPPGCAYLSPNDVHEIINGLPPGTTIKLDPIHAQFFGLVVNPGGPLGGEQEEFDSFLQLELTGTGELAGFSRLLNIPVHCVTATAPRTEGASVQSFDTEMVQLQGAIFGDPDFDQLSFQAGPGIGSGSNPGHTTLTRLGPPGSNFTVDSFFDIEYRVDFQGAPGSVLDGMSGSTLGTIRMSVPSSASLVPAGQPWGLIAFTAALLLSGGLLIRRRILA